MSEQAARVTLHDRVVAWRKALAVYRDRRMLVILLMGFASGLPFLLTASVLGYWLSTIGLKLETIGLFALVGIPYAFKFAWAPLIDHIGIPGLDRLLGRRRSWLMLSQIGLAMAISALAFTDPRIDPELTGLAAFFIAIFSATQDIVIDAYRIEILEDREQGAGSASTILGYRIALWIVDAAALLLPSLIGWQVTLLVIAALVGIAIIVTLKAAEPTVSRVQPTSWDRWIYEALIRPFMEFFKYRGWLIILLFALLYKFGDAVGGTMFRPFLNNIGFTGPEIFGISKSFGVISTLVGGVVGGVLVARYGIFGGLLIGGVAQAVTNLLFAWQAIEGHEIWILAVTLSADNFTNAIGSIAFVAYLSHLCTKGLAGTQYALLTSMMAFGRTVLSSGSGWAAANLSWPSFWLLTTLLAIPALLLLLYLWRVSKPANDAALSESAKPVH